MGRNVAASVGKVGVGLAPSARVRVSRRDIAGDGIPSKLPHPNALVPPLHSHDAAILVIEPLAIRIRGGAADAAAGVIVGAVIAVVGQGLARHLPFDAAHGAPVSRVQRHLVAVSRLVHGLHDVNLAVGRPVRLIREPERRPCAAAEGRVLHVEDEEAVVVLLLGLDAHRETTGRCVGLRTGSHARVYFQYCRAL